MNLFRIGFAFGFVVGALAVSMPVCVVAKLLISRYAKDAAKALLQQRLREIGEEQTDKLQRGRG